MNVLVTGANGFVGHSVLSQLNDVSGLKAIGSVRHVAISADASAPLVTVEELSAQTDWSGVLTGLQVVVHMAGRVHVMQEASDDPLKEFRRVNVQGTINLARQAAEAGVKRFLFVSSIKVNGEATQPGKPFKADDVPAPLDAYAISKMEAEQGLQEIARQTGMEVVIIRPPLVYGPGVKANFAVIVRWLKFGVPLPLGNIHNQRSLVALDNLVDLVVTCLTHPAAANQTFLVSDGEDVSTTELLLRMGKAFGLPVRLVPVPERWLKVAAALVGKRDVAQRLCGSMQVDIQKNCRLLGWTPPILMDEGLRRTAELGRVALLP